MSNRLEIQFEWLGRDGGGDLEQAFYADIGLAIGGDYLTQLEDIGARTLRNSVRGCAHHLAVWFAANWWRLRWEPEISSWSKNAEWRIAHSTASAGGGFVWPNVIFASDGNSIAVASRPSAKPAAFEPVRYLNRIDTRITAVEFEQKVDAFLDGVLSRLNSFKIKDEDLKNLWSEVLRERGDPEATQWRKLEALCGYDPDEAPPAMIEMLIDNQAILGAKAMEEVAAEGRHSAGSIIAEVLKLAKRKAPPTTVGFRGAFPSLKNAPKAVEGERPWQSAGKLAKFARSKWGLGNKPVSNAVLADLLRAQPGVFDKQAKAALTMPLALRVDASPDHYDIYFNSSWSTSRRFAASRMIGDHLSYANGGRLLPATDAKTSQQQFQRAFAQELLCPIDALLEKIQTEQPGDDDIEEAASYFGVSPLMVRTTMVNKGEMERESLGRAD